MKKVFYSQSSQFELKDEEFNSFIKALNNSKRVYIPRLGVFLSDMFIWAGEKPVSKDKIKLHDGGYAVKKFGEWVDERNGAKLDLNYYKYLSKDQTHEEYKKLKA